MSNLVYGAKKAWSFGQLFMRLTISVQMRQRKMVIKFLYIVFFINMLKNYKHRQLHIVLLMIENAIKKNSRIPLITKLADGDQILAAFYGEPELGSDLQTGPIAQKMLSEEIAINRIYESAVSLQTGCPMRNEYRTPIVII